MSKALQDISVTYLRSLAIVCELIEERIVKQPTYGDDLGVLYLKMDDVLQVLEELKKTKEVGDICRYLEGKS